MLAATQLRPPHRIEHWLFCQSVLGGGIKYLLRDEFTSALAAGAVNGTAAEPGPGTRTVVDVNSKLSITGGQLSFATGGGGSAEPRLSYESISRVAGRMLLATVNIALEGIMLNLSRIAVSGRESGFRIYSAGITVYTSDTALLVVGSWSTSTEYELALVLRTAGEFAFIKGGAFTNWTLLWSDPAGNTASLYPLIGADDGTSAFTIDDFRIPDVIWLPTPLAYDTFTRANGAIGTSETTGPDSQGVTARTWTGAAFTIDTNQAKGTPTQGSELVTNGDFTNWTGDDPNGWTIIGEDANNYVTENPAGQAQFISDGSLVLRAEQTILTIGKWYLLSVDCKASASGQLDVHDGTNWLLHSSALQTTGVKIGSNFTTSTFIRFARSAGGCDVTIDDVSIKELTLSTLFASVTVGTADVLAEVEVTVGDNHTCAGMVLNLDDAATPANFVLAYHDGRLAVLVKCVAGVYTTVITAGATYAAGAVLRVIKDGTSYSLYYNNVKIGSTSTISDAGIVDNTLHGLFSTYSGNRLDNFTVWPRGTGDEYAQLDKY